MQYDEVLQRRTLVTQMLHRTNPEDCSKAILQMVN
jgi:hypothetical protein